MSEFKDYTGKHINHFNVISFNSFNKHGESTWNVECDCGRSDLEIKTLSSIKRSGFGCRVCMNEYKLEEQKSKYIGEKFGKLTIVDYLGHRDDIKSKTPFWIAKCDCGSEKKIIATHYDIKSGRVSSCGCYIFDETYLNKVRKSGSKRKGSNKELDLGDYYQIECTNGHFFIDKCDLEKIKKLNSTFYLKDGYVYYSKNKKGFQLHRFLMELKEFEKLDNLIVDHINGERNDNRKINLRIINKKHNPKNCDIYKNNSSGIKGVSFIKRLNKWQSSIQVDKKAIYLGIYEEIEDAKKARENAEKKYFGEYNREIDYEI